MSERVMSGKLAILPSEVEPLTQGLRHPFPRPMILSSSKDEFSSDGSSSPKLALLLTNP